MYLGDYPHGASWSALVPPADGTLEEEDYTPLAEGSETRMRSDEWAGPVWSDEALLETSQSGSDAHSVAVKSLIADRLVWLGDMTAFHPASEFVTEEWRRRQGDLRKRGRYLAGRLRSEAGPPPGPISRVSRSAAPSREWAP